MRPRPARVLTKRMSRSVSRPFKRRDPSTTTSVPARVRRISATASASEVSGETAYGSRMMMCCIRLTFSTSRTCGSMSPLRNPRSMMPRPPSSACTIAIGARVTVSMLADTSGRFSVMWVEKRHDRSMTDGSRRVDHAVLRPQQEVVEGRAADDVRQRIKARGHRLLLYGIFSDVPCN